MGGALDQATGLGTLLGLGPGWLGTVLLLSLRLGAVFMMTPLLGGAAVPVRVRALLVLGLAMALSWGLPASVGTHMAQVARHPGLLIQAGFTELALGAVLGLGILLAFAVFTVAGHLLDTQIGFGLGRVIDPLSQQSTPLLASAFNQASVVVFFLVNGHHALLRGVFYSLERFPLGQPWPLGGAIEPVLHQAAALFSLAFALAAPVVFCLLLAEMAMGVLSRNLPQINMLILGFPLKIVAGLMVLAVWFSGIGPAMTRVYESIFRTWEGVMVAPSPESTPGERP